MPELEQAKAAVLSSLGSLQSRRSCGRAMQEFIGWYCSAPRLALNRAVALRYCMRLENMRLAAATINVGLAAIRRLATEAADSGLLSADLIAGIRRVRGVKQSGRRTVPLISPNGRGCWAVGRLLATTVNHGSETPAVRALGSKLAGGAAGAIARPAMTRLSMATTPTPDADATQRGFRPWDQGELPDAPVFEARNWTRLIGPSLLMAGANIGAGEWLFGPLVTAQYGGTVLWLATIAIFCQVGYNLGVMRYSLYTGESALVGFLRTPPGPRFWTAFYLVTDFGSLWPYLAANAAVPLAAVILGRLPGDEDGSLVRTLSYAIFLTAFVPLIFGGKIYNSLQRVMVTKLILVLLYLGFLALFFTTWATKWEILSGFARFGALPPGDFNWATLAAFAAISGAGGLTNLNFSSLVRDRGWGMGAQVGALPSAIGGRTIQLSHTGKVFQITAQTLKNWREWIRTIRRDQFVLWAPACVLGMALPAMVSYEFIRGVENVPGNAAAAMMADAIAVRHGQIFWFLTLLCGFIILAPSQVTNVDGICRRWTDVIWMGLRQLHHLPGHQVKYVYYGLLAAYCIWGMIALRLTPDPVVLAIGSAVLFNFAIGFSSLHLLFMTHKLLPKQLRLPWFLRIWLLFCAAFYVTISTIAFRQQWPNILEWLGS